MSEHEETGLKGYAVVPTHWEYNDEYYREEGNAAVIKVFTDRRKAKRACDQYLVQAAREPDNLVNFSWKYRDDPDGDLKERAWFDARGCLTESYGGKEVPDLVKILPEATMKQIKEVIEEMQISLVEIQEVEIE